MKNKTTNPKTRKTRPASARKARLIRLMERIGAAINLVDELAADPDLNAVAWRTTVEEVKEGAGPLHSAFCEVAQAAYLGR